MPKVALVTGASRGIGAVTAIELAKSGYDICINFKSNKGAAFKVLSEIESLGRRCVLVQADVSDEDDVVRMFKDLDQQLGPLSVLVNNAGILLPQTRVENLSAERINKVLSTNVTSYFLCCREAVKRMSVKHGGNGGAIVNVSSAASRLGSANEYVDYAASKGAIDTLTIGLSIEVANESIRVNGVRPGFIDTDMHASGGEPNRIERLKKHIPMQRGGHPREVASAIVYLVSDQASYVTGSFIDIAGGK